MSQTTIPTCQLRFVRRSIPAPEYGQGVHREIRVLQQLSHTTGGKPIWSDVPLEDEEPLAGGGV